jgi:hypothetical protein
VDGADPASASVCAVGAPHAPSRESSGSSAWANVGSPIHPSAIEARVIIAQPKVRRRN